MLEAINTPVLVIQVGLSPQSSDGGVLTPSFPPPGQSETSQIYPLEYAHSLVETLKTSGKDARLFVVKGKYKSPKIHLS